MMHKNIAIIKTGTTDSGLRKKVGDFEDWIIGFSGLPSDAFALLDLKTIPDWPLPQTFRAFIITGSHSNITDNPPWLPDLASYLRFAYGKKVAMLGICFGHQMLAHVLGGKVSDNPMGAEYGAVTVQVTEQGRVNPLFKNLPSSFAVFMSHKQTVIRLPTNARVLACSSLDKHAAFYLPPLVWGVQFHPEFTPEIMAWYLRQHYQINESEINLHLSSPVQATNIISEFIRLAIQRT